MEGQSVTSSKLRFIESKKKLRISSNDVPTSAGCKLIAAANNHAMIIVGSQDDNSIRAISFDQLMHFNQSQSKSDIVNHDQFKFVIPLNFRPNILTVARYGYSSILLVIGQTTLEAFDLDTQTSIGQAQLNITADIVDYAWHPNYFDSIVALCTKRGELLVISISRTDRSVFLVYSSQQYGSLSCCWSPKGKNLAIGMADGRVKRLEPVISATSFTFKDVDKSIITFTNPKITPQHRIVKLRWINQKHLLSVHAGPETVYSMFTVKPSAPYKYWTNICYESQSVPEQNYYIANLTDAAVCASNASGEAAVLGLDGDEWKSIIIDEEGSRIELPLDSNNSETFPRGLTVACLDKQPVLVFYTSASVICAYATSDASYQLPPLQPAIESPLTRQAAKQQPQFAPQLQAQTMPRPQPQVMPQTVSQPQAQTKTQPQPQVVSRPQPQTVPQPLVVQKMMQQLGQEIASIKVENLPTLEGVNLIRRELEEIEDIHRMHREATDAISKDIETLDAGMLENLYLIEYIKTHSKKQTKKRYLDPATQSKVESIRSKVEAISHKLRDLNTHVDIEWTLHKSKKGNKLDSLEMIYKTLTTQQKIISTLKRKASVLKPPTKDNLTDDSFGVSNKSVAPPTRELDLARLTAFREFLASRDTVPVRRPE